VFVEVRARGRRARVGPAESITATKRRRLAATALRYLAERDWLERPCRFDVVEVVGRGPGRAARVRHVLDAFRPDPPGG